MLWRTREAPGYSLCRHNHRAAVAGTGVQLCAIRNSLVMEVNAEIPPSPLPFGTRSVSLEPHSGTCSRRLRSVNRVCAEV